MAYILDATKAHKQSFIELVNSDNAGTIQAPLTLTSTLLVNEKVLGDDLATSTGREYGVTLQNAKYAADVVDVYFNKIALPDLVELRASQDAAESDFNWYDADVWTEDSPAQAIAKLKERAALVGIDTDNAMENISVTREFNETDNHYYLNFAFTSMVFKTGALFQMPRQFSDEVTVTALDGFAYEPIAAEDVVY